MQLILKCCSVTIYLLQIVQRGLARIDGWRNTIMDSTEKLAFEKLTPLDDHDIGIYKSAIDFAFEHLKIHRHAPRIAGKIN